MRPAERRDQDHLSRVSTKSQVTIPAEIRRLLGFAPHDTASFQVADVTERTVLTALAGAFHDFEDAVCHAAALEVGAELIVTRNLADFAAGTVPAVLPEMLLASLAG